MSINWVMLDEQGKKAFIPLPRERILAESPPRTAIVVRSATTGGGHNGPNPSQAAQPFNLSTSSGVAYITSQRLVYLTAPSSTPTLSSTLTSNSTSSSSSAQPLTSFSCPLLTLAETYVTAPYFGPNVLCAKFKPAASGGIPAPTAPPYLAELKLTFKEGGAYDFHAKLVDVRERLVQAAEAAGLNRSGGAGGGLRVLDVHGDELPAYEAAVGGRDGGRTGDAYGEAGPVEAPALSVADPARGAEQLRLRERPLPPSVPPPPADELPPGYEESQAGR